LRIAEGIVIWPLAVIFMDKLWCRNRYQVNRLPSDLRPRCSAVGGPSASPGLRCLWEGPHTP
jgi:hypothetical protein